MLRDAGIALHDFPEDLREELRAMNAPFLDQYRTNRKSSGSAIFDYVHSPKFTIGEPPLSIDTEWSHAGSGVIHAYSARGNIALARYAVSINEVDDPSAMDFSPDKHSVTANKGDIVIFRGTQQSTYAVVKIDEVLSLDRGDDRNEVTFSYDIRRIAIVGPLDRFFE